MDFRAALRSAFPILVCFFHPGKCDNLSRPVALQIRATEVRTCIPIRTRVRACTRNYATLPVAPRMNPFLHELNFGPIDEIGVLAELRRFMGVSGSGCNLPNFGFIATFRCPHAPRRLTCNLKPQKT